MVVKAQVHFFGANTPHQLLLAPMRLPEPCCWKEDLEAAYAGLDVLSTLVPPPMGNLPWRNHIRGGGDIDSRDRLVHSKSGGTTWMNSGQLQMMTALLLKDGRYDASVAVISCTDIQMIEGCFEILVARIFWWTTRRHNPAKVRKFTSVR